MPRLVSRCWDWTQGFASAREAFSHLGITHQPHLAGVLSLGDWFLACFLFYRTHKNHYQNANSRASLLRKSEKQVSGGLAPAFGTCTSWRLETRAVHTFLWPLLMFLPFFSWLREAGIRGSAWQADAAMSELFSQNSQGCLICSAIRLLLRETPMIPLII